MIKAGIRELRNHITLYLKRVKDGEIVVITQRKRPIASISPVKIERDKERLVSLIGKGLVSWNGGRPKGASILIQSSEKPISQIILEERR